MQQNIYKTIKLALRPGLIAYMEQKDPGKSLSTYKTYASDSNYLLNNGKEEEYVKFMRSDEDMPEIQSLIREMLIEKRGMDKVKNGDSYYYEKLCWQREYVKSVGGIDALLKPSN